MKRVLLSLVFISSLVTASYAADFKLGIGGGLFFDYYISRGVVSDTTTMDIHTKVVASSDNPSTGAFFYFDATYVELDLSYMFGFPKNQSTLNVSGGGMNMQTDSVARGTFQAIELSLLGKYPFTLGKFRIFPLLGASYIHVFYAEAEGHKADSPRDASTVGLLAGIGSDYALSDNLYIRGELLFNMRMPSGDQQSIYQDGNAPMGLGGRLKIGIGYSF